MSSSSSSSSSSAFAIENEFAFWYFVIFASLLSVSLSGFFALEFPIVYPLVKKENQGNNIPTIIQSVLFLLLAVDVALMTWIATTVTVTDDYDGGGWGSGNTIHPILTIGCGLYMILFLLYLAYSLKLQQQQQQQESDNRSNRNKLLLIIKGSHVNGIVFGIGFFGILLPGLIVFAISYHEDIIIDKYYRNELPISDYLIEFDGNVPCHYNNNNNNNNEEQKDTICGAYRAKVQVTWGGKGGKGKSSSFCSEKNPTLSCTRWIDESSCTVYTNQQKATKIEFINSTAIVQNCIEMTYPNISKVLQLLQLAENDDDDDKEEEQDNKTITTTTTTTLDTVDATTTTKIKPISDILPTIDYYHDCTEICNTVSPILMTDTILPRPQEMRKIGLIMSLTGAVIFSICCYKMFQTEFHDFFNNQKDKFQRLLNNNNDDDDDDGNEQQEEQVLEVQEEENNYANDNERRRSSFQLSVNGDERSLSSIENNSDGDDGDGDEEDNDNDDDLELGIVAVVEEECPPMVEARVMDSDEESPLIFSSDDDDNGDDDAYDYNDDSSFDSSCCSCCQVVDETTTISLSSSISRDDYDHSGGSNTSNEEDYSISDDCDDDDLDEGCRNDGNNNDDDGERSKASLVSSVFSFGGDLSDDDGERSKVSIISMGE